MIELVGIYSLLIFVIILWVFCRFERIFVIELVGKRELVEAATAC